MSRQLSGLSYGGRSLVDWRDHMPQRPKVHKLIKSVDNDEMNQETTLELVFVSPDGSKEDITLDVQQAHAVAAAIKDFLIGT